MNIDEIDREIVDKKELGKLSKSELISIILELQVDLRTCRLDNAELE